MNKHQHFETCLHFLAYKCLLTQVRLPYESNQLVQNSQDGNGIPIGDLSKSFSNWVNLGHDTNWCAGARETCVMGPINKTFYHYNFFTNSV